jgi:hypothetical protein
MYANHRHYTLFVFAIAAFVASSFCFIYMREKIYTQATRAVEITSEVKQLEDQKAHDLEVKNAYAKTAEEQTQINSYIVPKDKIVDFIETVENVGTETSSSVQLSNIVTKEIVKGKKVEDNFTSMTAHVDALGTWPSLMRVLTLVENLPYSESISNMHITTDVGAEVPEDTHASTTPKTAPKAKTWNMGFDIKVLILDNS